MPYVTIHSRDGEFEIRPMSDRDADRVSSQGEDPILIEDDVYDAWVAHMKQHRVFNTLWRHLQNQHAERATRIYGKKS